MRPIDCTSPKPSLSLLTASPTSPACGTEREAQGSRARAQGRWPRGRAAARKRARTLDPALKASSALVSTPTYLRRTAGAREPVRRACAATVSRAAPHLHDQATTARKIMKSIRPCVVYRKRK
eukprot:scaffold272786_cov27-Tisochrysis_lutea.AAC.2